MRSTYAVRSPFLATFLPRSGRRTGTRTGGTRRWQRHKAISMRRFRVTFRAVVICDGFAAISKNEVTQRPPEELERGLGLVVRDLVTSFVDPRGAETSVFADLAVLLAVDDERLVPSRAELFGLVILDLEGDGFAAEPVAWRAIMSAVS